MNKVNALVIGASSGIGAELVRQLSNSNRFDFVHGVSRNKNQDPNSKVINHQVDSLDEKQISDLCTELRSYGEFVLVVCCIGILHSEEKGNSVKPEKRLEDVSATQLESYFKINSIAPMLWIKHLHPLFSETEKSQLVVLSARVGSIADNKLGGWYGYRASKAALNMLVKSSQVEYTRRTNAVELVCYHPGTVDTGLSKPFQSNVPQKKLFTVSFTVEKLLAHLQTLDAELAPHFIDWDNKTIPW